MTRNQTKTEPIPASPSQSEALDDAPGTSEEHDRVQGVHTPDPEETDTRLSSTGG